MLVFSEALALFLQRLMIVGPLPQLLKVGHDLLQGLPTPELPRD